MRFSNSQSIAYKEILFITISIFCSSKSMCYSFNTINNWTCKVISRINSKIKKSKETSSKCASSLAGFVSSNLKINLPLNDC
uniref:Candidate secreted effector n=1 Tax=Meloidogyne incognita TaxID=6306 RepID=A0A914L5F6_MELIC